MANIKQQIIDMLDAAMENNDYTGTWYTPLGVYNGKVWAACAAWMDYDNNGNYELYAKIACQPKNSMMQEYDIDWDMPFDPTFNEVNDTERCISSDSIEIETEWLLDEWDYILQNIIPLEGE